MTPVTFATLENGRIEALIGKTVVGVVSFWEASPSPAVDAWFQMFLPIDGTKNPPHPASTIAAAKRSLLAALADWHQKASPSLYANMITALRMQAEGERG